MPQYDSSTDPNAAKKDEKEPSKVPFLSLNTEITAELPGPSEEELEKFKKADPKLQYWDSSKNQMANSTWTIWEQRVKDKKADWAEQFKQAAQFSTVKEFWSCWNHLPQPSTLLSGQKFVRQENDVSTIVTSLMIFRKGIKPEWEDPWNAQGGHFLLSLKPDLGGAQVDELWNNVVMGMIIGAIEPADMITGVRLVDKTSDKNFPLIKLELWFNDIDKEDSGRLFKLRGSFEACMRTDIEGGDRKKIWPNTEKVPHAKEDVKERPPPRRGSVR